jgi:hypothetical protein
MPTLKQVKPSRLITYGEDYYGEKQKTHSQPDEHSLDEITHRPANPHTYKKAGRYTQSAGISRSAFFGLIFFLGHFSLLNYLMG